MIPPISISNTPLAYFSLFAVQMNHFDSDLTCTFELNFAEFGG
jgi:hypothetical protein